MGFIYKIEIDNQIYIGSTKQKLCRRQTNHNCSLNNSNDSHYNIYLYRFCRTHNIEKIICETSLSIFSTNSILKFTFFCQIW